MCDREQLLTRLQKTPTMLLLLGLTLASLTVLAEAVPLYKADTSQLTEVVSYFMRFGHTNPTELKKADKVGALSILSEDMRQFQKFAGLKETGELDEATQKRLQEPRCPVKESANRNRKTARRKRWAVHGSKWTNRQLTYSVENTPTLVRERLSTDNVLKAALNTWAKEANISFREIPDGENAHIKIKFVTGDHGDGEPFDGRGGTLAHAFFPIYGGDAHFDDDEPWSINSGHGTNLYAAATHEFGHSLGLAHSKINSMMSPWYQTVAKLDNPKKRSLLAQDDIDAIRLLYGRRESEIPPTEDRESGMITRGRTGHTHTQRRSHQQTAYFPFNLGFISTVGADIQNMTRLHGDPILCENARMDAVLSDNGTKYAFQGQNYWRLTDAGVATGYPRTITAEWDGVPSPLDAALYSKARGIVYMFKGDKVWKFTGDYTIESGYPKLMSAEFPGMADRDLSAAFEWGKDGLIYMVKGSQYWKQGTKGPKPLSQWSGLPAIIDAATQYSSGKTYFFSGQNYYRFDDDNFKVHGKLRVLHPRDTGRVWFQCRR